MSMQKRDKLKLLLENWPDDYLLTAKWLRKKGYSKSNIQKYLSSGWIQRVGEGCYKKHNHHINHIGVLYALSGVMACHIGGKTALEMQGAAHYIKMQDGNLYFFINGYKRVPKWVKEGYTYVADIIFVSTEFIEDKEDKIGINYIQEDDFRRKLVSIFFEQRPPGEEFEIKISSRERAILEYIYLVGKEHSYEECDLIMENLSNLRPQVLQQLLENCHSVRVKRLFLFLAKRHNHPYFSELDMSKIDLGKGYRELVKGGVYDGEFQINYPKEWAKDEHENKF